jgi:MGT family glycosyltransferase
MKRIVFFSIPLFGHVNYGLKIAKELKGNGYEVIYYSGTAYKQFIDDAGIVFQPYSKEIETLFSFKDSAYNNEYMQNIRAEKLDHIYEWFKFCHHVYSIADIFMRIDINEMLQPDLVVYDSAALWGRYVSKHWGVNSIASCTPYTYPEKYAYEDLHRFSRLIFQKNLDKLEVKRLIHILNYKLEHAFLNLSPCSIFEPLSPRADYKFIYTVKEFQSGCEYMDLDTTFFCGIMYENEKTTVDYSDWVSSSVPTVYIAFGSIYNNASVFQQIYENCKHLNYNFILNIGETLDSSIFAHLPSNWKVVKHLNQLELLKLVTVFVSHGGVNSVREAMHCGVPIIVLPTEGDTLCIAEDIKEKKLGVVLNISNIDSIGLAVEKLIRNKMIKENCNKLSRIMQHSAGLCGVVDIIKKIMKE